MIERAPSPSSPCPADPLAWAALRRGTEPTPEPGSGASPVQPPPAPFGHPQHIVGHD